METYQLTAELTRQHLVCADEAAKIYWHDWGVAPLLTLFGLINNLSRKSALGENATLWNKNVFKIAFLCIIIVFSPTITDGNPVFNVTLLWVIYSDNVWKKIQAYSDGVKAQPEVCELELSRVLISLLASDREWLLWLHIDMSHRPVASV